MNHEATRGVRWRRLSAEGVVIVGSILLAFGVQAWWESRGETLQSRALIAALSEDFETAGRRLRVTQTSHERAFLSAERLLTYAEDGAVPETERAQIALVEMTRSVKLGGEPPLLSYHAILSSNSDAERTSMSPSPSKSVAKTELA